MSDTLRDRALKIAECPWAYASSDVAAVIQELLSKIPASKTCPRCNGTGSPPPVGMNDGRMVYHYPCPVCIGSVTVGANLWRDIVGVDAGRAMRNGYLLGFMASGEGYNGEYPFGDKGTDPESDDEWRNARDEAISVALSAREGDDGREEP